MADGRNSKPRRIRDLAAVLEASQMWADGSCVAIVLGQADLKS